MDVTDAPVQDEIANSLVAEPEAQEQPTDQAVTEQPTEVAPQEQTTEQTEQTTEEQPENWLPTEQEKVFPDEVLAKYAQRYGLDESSLSNPQIRQLVVDKINTDIFVRQQQEAQQQWEQQEETQQEQQPEPTQPQLSRDEYFRALDRTIQERTDPEVAKQFHSDFLRAFGVPEQEIAKASPQQAMAFTHTASKYMLNLMNTFMDDMISTRLQNQVAQAFPGFGEMYERSSYGMAWDRVRNSNPSFSALPAYGTKEFSKTMRTAAERIPGFDEMQFTGPDGKPLSPMDNAARKYTMLAQIAAGQNVDPALLQKAAATVAKRTHQANVRKAAGNLGSGKSNAASAPRGSTKFQSNADIFDDETMAIWNREHGRI